MWEQYEVWWDDITPSRKNRLLAQFIQNNPELWEGDDTVRDAEEANEVVHIRLKAEQWFVDHQPYYID